MEANTTTVQPLSRTNARLKVAIFHQRADSTEDASRAPTWATNPAVQTAQKPLRKRCCVSPAESETSSASRNINCSTTPNSQRSCRSGVASSMTPVCYCPWRCQHSVQAILDGCQHRRTVLGRVPHDGHHDDADKDLGHAHRVYS